MNPATFINRDVLRVTCSSLTKFKNHYRVTVNPASLSDDDDLIALSDGEDEIGEFNRCKKCNGPTIAHKKPINDKCEYETIDDDDIVDIENEIKKDETFKAMKAKLIGNVKKASEKKEDEDKRTCDVCKKVFKTEENMTNHQSKHTNTNKNTDISQIIDFLKVSECDHS